MPFCAVAPTSGIWIIIFTVSKRFPGIVLTCWTQLFRFSCRILLYCHLVNSAVAYRAVNSKPFHVNYSNASLRTGARWCCYFSLCGYCDIIVNLFCFCSENSTNVLTCLMLKQLITGASNGLLPITRGVQISDPFFLKEMKVCTVPFLCGPLSFSCCR